MMTLISICVVKLFQEMQQMSLLQPQQNMPDMTELMMKWLGGSDNKNSNKKKEIKSKPSKKQQ